MVDNSGMVVQQLSYYVHKETSNQSFLDMHYYLKMKGIKNNAFFLALYDTDLIGVDPRDPNLTGVMKAKILRECIHNYWYFLREVVRLPQEGGNSAPYRLDRGSLAMNFLFIMNYNQYVELPRQFGKTTTAVIRYLWVYSFGTANSQIMFIHKDHDGSKNNLSNLKKYRDALPSYLQMTDMVGQNGKRIRVPNTVETLVNPINHNSVKTLPSARNKVVANNLGRGCTMALQYYDEFAFIIHNKIIYMAATPAFETASKFARQAGAPFGITITSTPGDLLTDQGSYAYDVINNATPWQEEYYDRTFEQLEELHEANTKSSFFYVKYTYQQLGGNEEYFKNMCRDMQNSWADIRREVLLEWSVAATNCPISYEDLEAIKQYSHPPIRTMFFGHAKQYQFNVYEEYDMRYPPIIGVDVAAGLGLATEDCSAITILDGKTTKVCATFNCNYITTDELARLIYELVTKYMPNAIVNIEKNSVGQGVLPLLIKSSIKKNLYYEIKERQVSEVLNGYRVSHNKTQKVKVYGLDNVHKTRERLMELLFSRVRYHKDKFICPKLVEELGSLEQKKNGRIEATVNAHDDQVFSYLMAIYVFYDGKNLRENWGFQKTEIQTDEELDDSIVGIADDLNGETEDLPLDELQPEHDAKIDENTIENIDLIQIMENDAKNFQTTKTFEQVQDREDDKALQRLFAANPYARQKYYEKYHYDPSTFTYNGLNDMSFHNSNMLDVVDNFYEDDDQEYSIYQGNLGKVFEKIDQ